MGAIQWLPAQPPPWISVNKNIRYVVSDLVKAGLLWLWLGRGVSGAGNVMALWIVFMFALSLPFLSRQIRVNVRRAWWRADRGNRYAPWRDRLDIAFDVLVAAALAWFGHMMLATLALASLLLVSFAVFGHDGEDRDEPDTGFAHDETAA